MGNAPSLPLSPVEEEQRKEGETLVPDPVPVHSSAAPIRQSVNYPTVPEEDTCEICIEPVLSPNNLFNNGGKCNHPICTKCMIKYIQAKLEDNISRIRCPDLLCTEFLDPLNSRGLVGPELFVRWCDALCERALMGVVKSYCPNRNCSALIVNECGEIVKRVVCPNCKLPFCFRCKIPWHDAFTCIEIGDGGRGFDRNDRAFGELAVRMKWKRCPQCHQFVELTDGCSYVACRCGAYFCYKCGKQVYSHWCSNCEGTYLLCHAVMVVFIFMVMAVTVLIRVFINPRFPHPPSTR